MSERPAAFPANRAAEGDDSAHMNLDCGIAHERIRSWLDDELGLPHEPGCWVFAANGGNCRITIRPLEPRPLGMVKLERTNLVATGDACALDPFQKLFTLRFISAGG